MRVVVEIIEGLKKICPPEVPVGIRLCAEELLDDVRGNTPVSPWRVTGSLRSGCRLPERYGRMAKNPLSRSISRDVPRAAAPPGQESEAELENPCDDGLQAVRPKYPHSAIEKGELDMWKMCRPMIADPLLPGRFWKEGRRTPSVCGVQLCLARALQGCAP